MSSSDSCSNTLIEISNAIWSELTWLGRITIFVPLYILAVYMVISIVILDKIEKIGVPKVIVDGCRKFGRLFIKGSDA